MILFKLALKEIYNNKRFTFIFVFSLFLGLFGLVTVNALKTSIQLTMNSKSKGLIASDISVGARRHLTPEENKILDEALPSGSQSSRITESFTMVSGPQISRLVELKVIEASYPYYGEIRLNKQGLVVSGTAKDIIQSPKIWMYPELLLQLDLKVGDSIKIGKQNFTISDEVIGDSSAIGNGFSFAPPVYIGSEFYQKTGLSQFGSTGYHSRLIQLPSHIDVEKLADDINQKLNDPGIQVTTGKNASDQFARLLNYLNDYLSLSALVALMLTAIGQGFLFRNYLTKRTKDIAIFKSLGLSPSRIFIFYTLQILIFSTLALIPTFVSSLFVLPLLEKPLYLMLDSEVNLQLSLPVLFFATLTSSGFSLLITGPLTLNALRLKPKDILSKSSGAEAHSYFRNFLFYLPALVTFWIMSIVLSNSIQTGSLFFAIYFLSLGLLFLVGHFSITILANQLLKNAGHSGLSLLNISLKHLVREKFATLSVFVAISLGVLLANLIPQLELSLQNEINPPNPESQASLFMFDIQEDQKEDLEGHLDKMGFSPMIISPMIRARLSEVNSLAFEKSLARGTGWTREEETENRFRNRGFNITYRDTLSESEILISRKSTRKELDGRASDTTTDSKYYPEISLETRFAKRLNLSLGDILTFDIQGVPVSGEVTSLRKIRWTSFQPNFFIQFNSDTLKDAPKTYLLTMPQMDVKSKIEIQQSVVRKFPNISIIDITRLIEKLNDIVRQISVALKAMSWLALFVSVFILLSINYQQTDERQNEVSLLKTLGASRQQVRFIFFLEFLIVLITALFFGALLSFAAAWFVVKFIFDSTLFLNLQSPLLFSTLIIFISTWIAYLIMQGTLNKKPKDLLSGMS